MKEFFEDVRRGLFIGLVATIGCFAATWFVAIILGPIIFIGTVVVISVLMLFLTLCAAIGQGQGEQK